MIIVSACLAGVNCRHDGKSATYQEVRRLVKAGEALPLCPEQLGGLPTPRIPAEIVNGSGEDVLDGKTKVVNAEGEDVTRQYIRGAEEVSHLINLTGAKKAILKAGSPSCGLGRIRKRGRLVKGNGVCAALLLRAGIKVTAK